MPFTVVHGSPQDIWVPISYGDTMYVGGIAGWDATDVGDHDGVHMFPVAAGVWNATNYDIPLGAIIGTNLRNPVFDTTGKCEYITSATPLASTTEFVLTGGPYPGGGREHFVKVSLIDPCTTLRGNLFDSAVGTAPTVGTVTTGDTNGVSCTTGAVSVASIDGMSTIYFRTGANKGTYRTLDSTASTTTHTWNIPTYAAVAVGDTAVVVNIKMIGLSRAQTLATYINCFDIDEAATSHYFAIDVTRLDLSVAGGEYVDFRWNIINFYPATGRD